MLIKFEQGGSVMFVVIGLKNAKQYFEKDRAKLQSESFFTAKSTVRPNWPWYRSAAVKTAVVPAKFCNGFLANGNFDK